MSDTLGYARVRPRMPAFPQRTELGDTLRVVAIAVILLVELVGANAFLDLRSTSFIQTSEGGNALNQVLFVGIGVITLLSLYARGLSALRPFFSWPGALTAAWFLINTALSTHPALSARRLISLVICLLAAAAVFLIARSVRQFVIGFAATALIILVTSYLSLIVVPNLAMHTGADILEPEHAGRWRGVFFHKNQAGSIMVLLIFVGLFARRVIGPRVGAAIVIPALVFILFTGAKTPMALMPVALLQSWIVRWRTGTLLRGLVLLTPLVFLLVVSVGTVLFPDIEALVHQVVPDLTYTGRTELWEFTIDNIMKRPIEGFGYGAFWGTTDTFYGTAVSNWFNMAGDAHDGYLNATIELGLVGLALTLALMVFKPLLDLQHGLTGRALDPVSTFFVRWWVFSISSAVFEGIFYHVNNGGFFVLMVACYGLHLRTKTLMIAR